MQIMYFDRCRWNPVDCEKRSCLVWTLFQANLLMRCNGLEETYLPTPTIIEAARALYAQHSVDVLSHGMTPELRILR